MVIVIFVFSYQIPVLVIFIRILTIAHESAIRIIGAVTGIKPRLLARAGAEIKYQKDG